MALTTGNRSNQSQRGGLILLVVLSLLSVIIVTVWSREGENGPIHQLRAGLGSITAPLERVGSVLATPLDAVYRLFSNSGADPADYDLLLAENEALRAEVARLQEYEAENARLTSLLDIPSAYGLESLGAHVISRSLDSYDRILTIDRGSESGILSGMPVVSANGLIGQIETVSLGASTVRLITDESSGVAVFLQSSRTEGIVSATADGTLMLDFISLSVPVKIHEVVVTSGAGGVYPKGLVIGEVVAVSYEPSDVYQTITVRPFTRVDSYEEVLVLVGGESEIKPTTSGEQQDTGEGTTPPDAGGEGGEGAATGASSASGGSAKR